MPRITPKINSKIFESEEDQRYEFLWEQLGKPRKISLLYRASENNFRASAFHQNCGDKPNTLTIART